MTSNEQLLEEYRQGRKELNKRYTEMDNDDPDRKTIGSMAREMTFVIDWLENGQMPEEKITFNYGVNGYWDESIGSFVALSNYKNPYLEVEERIDKELEEKRNESSRVNR